MPEDFVGASTYELYRKVFDIEDLDDAFLDVAMREASELPEDRARSDARIDELSARADGELTREERLELRRLVRDRVRLERVSEVREERRIERDRVEHLELKVAGLQHELAAAERRLAGEHAE